MVIQTEQHSLSDPLYIQHFGAISNFQRKKGNKNQTLPIGTIADIKACREYSQSFLGEEFDPISFGIALDGFIENPDQRFNLQEMVVN